MAIDYGSSKKEVALHSISRRVTGEGWKEGPPAESCLNGDIYYIGSGYWRVLVDEGKRQMRLIEPGRSGADIAIVEQGVCKLLYYDYVPDFNTGQLVTLDRDSWKQFLREWEELRDAVKQLKKEAQEYENNSNE